MLYTKNGKPRAAIFSINHLSDPERMFFVSMLLNEVLGWMRTQPGTSSLRALLYMDEIYGYFPPVQNPPSKAPLLTLLKQARAFGLGVVLSTQNPVDLDYKGLSNTGTWFIGRLQTERDKQRVLAGLEGAASGTGFNRGRMEEILAGLGQRVFLLHNVHENQPVIFQTRWAMSYLRGPMTREQIKQLATQRGDDSLPATAADSLHESPVPAKTAEAAKPATGPPMGPQGIDSFYLAASGAGQGLVYFPAVIGRMDVHYSNARYRVDSTETLALLSKFQDSPVALDWDNAVTFAADDIETAPLPGAVYTDLPAAAKKAASYRKWNKDLLRWVRQNRPLVLYRSSRFRMASQPGESEGEFRAKLAQAVREKRDMEAEKLRRKYNSRFATLRDRLLRARQAIDREEEQSKSRKVQTAISFGTAILGAFLGRKTISAGSASRVGTAMRSASRMRKEKMDVARARERAAAIEEQLMELDARLHDDIEKIEFTYDSETEELEEIIVKPKSTGIILEVFGLAWIPFRQDASGRLSPDWG
jgi:hypothetical protein